MEVRSKYHVEAEYRQTQQEFKTALIHSISMAILAAFAAIPIVYRYEVGCLFLSLLILVLVYLVQLPLLQKRRNTLKQELSTFEEQELQFSIAQSGLDADEWHFGVGRKKKKKGEESDEFVEYFDDLDGFTEIIDED